MLQLQLTDSAVRKVKQLLEAESKSGHALRVAVRGGGCAGFEYGLTFDDQARPNDQVLEFDGLRVYVDAMSQLHLEGVRIDWVESLQGAGFKIENPNAKSACGCGHSFSA